MKLLLQRYKRFLIGTVLIIIGATLLFGSVFYLVPRREHLDYFPFLVKTLIYVTIVVISFILMWIGFGAWSNDSDIKELFNNFNKAFRKNTEE